MKRAVEDHRRYLLHFLALSSFAIAQPLFDIVSKNLELLVAQKATLSDLSILIALVSFSIPILLYLPGSLLQRKSEKLGVIVLTSTMGLLVSLLLLIMLKNMYPLADTILIAIALLGGGAFAFFYPRRLSLRMFCSFISPAVIAVPVIFLFVSDVSRIAFDKSEAEVEAAGNLSTSFAATDTPVVMLLLDELPLISLLDENIQIDSIRYPNFSAIATGSHWFRSAQSESGTTSVAAPAIISGVTKPGAIPILTDYPQNLFTLLGPSHELEITEVVSDLCPPRFCSHTPEDPSTETNLRGFLTDLSIVYLHIAAPPGLSRHLPVVSQSWNNFSRIRITTSGETEGIQWQTSAKARYDNFLAFVDSIDASDATTLYFYHALLPHGPWEYLPSGKLYSLTSNQALELDPVEDRWGDNDFLVAQGYQRHLLQLGFTDRLLGLLIDRLKAEGLYDKSLIVVVGDHGANFWPNEQRRKLATDEQRLDVSGIPMFIKLPNQQDGVIHEEPAKTVDIVPTLAGQLNLTLNSRVDGQDLFATDSLNHQELGSSSTIYDDNLTLEHKLMLFGSGEMERIYEFGSVPQLLGLSTAGLVAAVDDSLMFEISEQGYLDEVDLTQGAIPSWLTGKITGNMVTLENLELLIAINGKTVASTRSYKSGEDQLFSVMVPESVFVDGSNEVSMYRVDTTADNGTSLRQLLDLRASYYRYLAKTDQTSALISDQQDNTFTFAPGRISGAINLEKPDDNYLQLNGWAVDNERQAPAEFFLLSVAGELFYLGYPNIDRQDIVQEFDNSNAVLRSGFSFKIPSSRINFPGPASVDLIAISDSYASSIASFSYISNEGDRIAPTSTAANNFRLISDTAIVGPNEETIQLTTEQSTGHIDRAELSDGIVKIAGWAINDEGNQTAEYFLLQIDQQLLYLGGSNNSRPDVSTNLNNPELENSGFLIVMDESLLNLESSARMRLIAVSGSKAIEVISTTPLEQLLAQ